MTERVIGAFLLTAAGFAAAGLRLREGLRRAAFAEALEEAFRRMKTQAVLCLEPLPEMLEREARGTKLSASFFQAVLERYRAGIGFQNAWETSVRQTESVSSEIAAVLQPLGAVLGACMAEVQGEALERAADALKAWKEICRTTVQKRGMLEMRLFPCICLTTALLLWQ